MDQRFLLFYCLVGNIHYPVIFDHTHPREKPCGGLVTPFAQRFFPFLKRLPIKHGEKRKLRLISPSGGQVCLSTRKSEFRIFSRLKLDQFLVNVTVDKSAELVKGKVVALGRGKDCWKVKTTRHARYAPRDTCDSTIINAKEQIQKKT